MSVWYNEKITNNFMISSSHAKSIGLSVGYNLKRKHLKMFPLNEQNKNFVTMYTHFK